MRRLPLALRVAAELAAARAAVPLPSWSASWLISSGGWTCWTRAGIPATAVRAVFSWSCRHLDPAAARAFRLLGLHPGPDFDRYAAAALAGGTVAAGRARA